MMEKRGVLKRLTIGFLIFICFWSLLPVFTIGVMGVGVIAPMAFSLFLIGLIISWDGLKRKNTKLSKIVRAASLCIVTLVLVTAGVLFCFMSAAMHHKPPQGSTTTIVLGCKVNGNSPSRMLNDRIKAAYGYLKTNNNPCITTGGMGEDEIITEALCEKETLERMGIDGKRIFMEDQSTSTIENFQNSLEIIEQHSLSKNVVIATDNFHQFRAGLIAKAYGLTPYAAPTETVWYLRFYYWIREMFAIINYVFLT